MGREFAASSTCGLLGPEDFLGVFPGFSGSLVCDSTDPAKSYPPGHLSDPDSMPESGGNRTWWLAENGNEDVTLTLDLGGFYFLRSVRVSFLSPVPAVAIVEVSQDSGGSYHPLRYYSEDCAVDFDLPDTPLGGSGGREPKPDELVCTSNFSGGLSGLVSD